MFTKSDDFRRTCFSTLFEAKVKEIDKVWKFQGNTELKTGYDGHANENSRTLFIITETLEKLTAFKDCVDPKEDSESGERTANTIMVQMEKVIEAEKSVETVHACAVCDNISCNRTASRLIKEKYPTLFAPGRCTHVSNLLMEDIYKTRAFKKTTSDFRFWRYLSRNIA